MTKTSRTPLTERRLLKLARPFIIIAALIPALLYFYAVYVQISLLADKHDLGAGEQEAAKPAAEILRHAMVVIVPIGALLLGMFAFNMEAERAVVWASLALLAIGLLNLAGLHRIRFAEVARALYDAGRDAAEILLICAVAGMIIGLLLQRSHSSTTVRHSS